MEGQGFVQASLLPAFEVFFPGKRSLPLLAQGDAEMTNCALRGRVPAVRERELGRFCRQRTKERGRELIRGPCLYLTDSWCSGQARWRWGACGGGTICHAWCGGGCRWDGNTALCCNSQHHPCTSLLVIA